MASGLAGGAGANPVEGDQGVRGGIVVVRPARPSGVSLHAARAAEELRTRGHRIIELAVPERPVPAVGGVRAALACRRIIREADVVHLELGALDGTLFWFGLVAGGLARMVMVSHDAPRIVGAPGTGLIGGGSRWRDIVGHRIFSPLLDGRLRAWLSSSAHVGVVLTDAARRAWGATGPSEIVVVDHGAGPPSASRVPPSEGRHVLYAGYLGPSKGIDLLLEAWGEIGGKAGMPLVIAGTHTGSREDQRYARELHHRASALVKPPLWRGWVSDQELERLFAEAAVVVVPYRRSNPASGVIVRAMVEGRPIVAARVPAALDALRDREDALLVAPDDMAGLSRGIMALVSNPGLRDALGASAARRAAERFSWERHVIGLEAAYRIACEGR
jgi:glycosyltransferase involved in cell wall biosynthesis